MWRWPVVAKRRDAVNAVKWKIFAIHAKLIAIAAQKWADPDMNAALHSAIIKA
jgi:transcriptional/translational regulatory protein YebC/TACO1